MSGIIYDTSKIKACEGFYAICDYAEFDRQWTDELWKDVLTHPLIYEELVYYLEHHTFRDKVKIEGYSLSDLYVFQIHPYMWNSEGFLNFLVVVNYLKSKGAIFVAPSEVNFENREGNK